MGTQVVDVRQVARTLTAALTDSLPIIALPLGAVLPVECHGLEREPQCTIGGGDEVILTELPVRVEDRPQRAQRHGEAVAGRARIL